MGRGTVRKTGVSPGESVAAQLVQEDDAEARIGRAGYFLDRDFGHAIKLSATLPMIKTVLAPANRAARNRKVALSTAPPSRFRWAVLALATFAQIGGSFLVQGLGALGPALQAAFALDAAQVGLAMSAAQAVPIAGLIVAGVLLDRFDERRIVGLGAAIVAAALFAAARAESYGGVLFWLAVASIGYCTVQPGGGKVVSAWFSADTRGFAMGIRQAGLPLGAALGALILPVAAARHGWRAAFDLGAFAALLSGLAFAFLYRPPPEPLPERRRGASLWRERLREIAPRLPRIVWPGVALVLGIAAFIAAPGAPLWAVALVAIWLGFFGFGWYGPWIALVAEAAPRGAIGFMIGLAMAINQIFVVLAPPAFGALRDATGTFVWGWGLIAFAVVVVLLRQARANCRR